MSDIPEEWYDQGQSKDLEVSDIVQKLKELTNQDLSMQSKEFKMGYIKALDDAISVIEKSSLEVED